MDDFKIGDHVELIENVDGLKEGARGVIVTIKDKNKVRALFGVNIYLKNHEINLHSLEGFLKTDDGWWCRRDAIKKIMNTDEILEGILS